MQYRQLGTSRLTGSVAGQGCNDFGGAPIKTPSATQAARWRARAYDRAELPGLPGTVLAELAP